MIAMATVAGNGEVICSRSCFRVKNRYAQPETLADIVIQPKNMNTEPIVCPNPKLSACFKIRVNAFHADLK